MPADQGLDEYWRKRDFDRTAEPEGSADPDVSAEAADDGDTSVSTPSFVVQKHAATRLHYDVRLEVDGVLASWAVPKGPSYDPAVKRLAVHVEDHPVDYRDFEGVIPRGEYGGGAVIVWDRGTYRNLTTKSAKPVDVAAAIKSGHLSVWLEGTKLVGGWSLTRTSGPVGAKEQWIMVKRNDEAVDTSADVVTSQPQSVISGLTIDQMGADVQAPTWTRAVATWRPPMLAERCEPSDLARTRSSDGTGPAGWSYERKLDGLRCLAVRNGADIALWSRNHLRFDHRFPEIIAELGRLAADNFVLDGELVAFDQGRSSFGLLQRGGGAATPMYCVFDVIHLLGHDTSGLSLTERRALLARLGPPVGVPGRSGPYSLAQDNLIRVVEELAGPDGGPEAILARACAEGWEGVVAKDVSSTYVSGRSSAWRKLKCTAGQEMVIGGWTNPRGSRTGFGALLLGYYDDSGLRFAGKVGTGFDTATLKSLYSELVAREQDRSPFVERVTDRAAHWARPELVAQIAFSEWTADAKLRHPSFVALRTDRDVQSVRREGQ